MTEIYAKTGMGSEMIGSLPVLYFEQFGIDKRVRRGIQYQITNAKGVVI